MLPINTFKTVHLDLQVCEFYVINVYHNAVHTRFHPAHNWMFQQDSGIKGDIKTEETIVIY